MAVKTETAHAGEFVQALANGDRSKEKITVKSGQTPKVGDVLAREATGLTTSDVADAGNAGDGTIGSVTAGVTAKEGEYVLTCIEPAANAGAFSVEDPDGETIGVATVAVAFSGAIGFTVADGATDFAAGDIFRVTVSQGTGKWKVLPNDGTEEAAGILWEDVDATAADTDGVGVVRDATVNTNGINWPTGISAEDKDLAIGQLEERGIVLR